MRTLEQAVHEFTVNLNLSDRERREAKRQKEVLRANLRAWPVVQRDFISGSYKRGTAIRPLHDIDLFLVLDRNKDPKLTSASPHEVLLELRERLRAAYPERRDLPKLQNRSVNIQFDGTGIGYDVVPAFSRKGHYLVPDRDLKRWIQSRPDDHVAVLDRAVKRVGEKLKPLIRMLKAGNQESGKPLRSFHLEVMACAVLKKPPSSYLEGLQVLFSGLAEAVLQPCPEPARLGPALDADLTPGQREQAQTRLRSAAREVRLAVGDAEHGRLGLAHSRLFKLFGPAYPERGSR